VYLREASRNDRLRTKRAGFMAARYEEAVRLCEDCPHLDFGLIEVREVDELD